MKWDKTNDPRVKRRDGIYWARFMKRGVRVEQSLETRNFALAKALVSEIEEKVLARKSWKREKQLFKEAWLEFLIDKNSGNRVRPARKKTLREYTGFGVRYYLPFFQDHRLSDIDEELWVKFTQWVNETRGGVQFFNIRKYFMGFLTWARRHNKIKDNIYLLDPDAKKNKEKEEYSPGKAYTLDELGRLRIASAHHKQFHLFMLMAQFMGMRPGEINQLKKDRISLASGIIDLKRADTKTNWSRRVPIHREVILRLEHQIAAHNDSPYLFPNRRDKCRPMDSQGFKNVWYKVAKNAGVEGRMYDFRHTFITHAIAAGMNPAIVAEITGTSISIIQKYYLHLTENDLNTAMKQFSLGKI